MCPSADSTRERPSGSWASSRVDSAARRSRCRADSRSFTFCTLGRGPRNRHWPAAWAQRSLPAGATTSPGTSAGGSRAGSRGPTSRSRATSTAPSSTNSSASGTASSRIGRSLAPSGYRTARRKPTTRVPGSWSIAGCSKQRVLRGLLREPRAVVSLPLRPVEPGLDRARVDEARQRAERVVMGAVELRSQDPPAALRLEAAELGRALRSRVTGPTLELLLEPSAIESKLAELRRLEHEPRDAKFADEPPERSERRARGARPQARHGGRFPGPARGSHHAVALRRARLGSLGRCPS